MILISSQVEIVPCKKAQREQIDRMAFERGISWQRLRKMMLEWVGCDGFNRIMSSGEATMVIRKLKEIR